VNTQTGIDYSAMDIETLEALRQSIMHSINQAEEALPALHHEYTHIRLALVAKRAEEHETEAEGQGQP